MSQQPPSHSKFTDLMKAGRVAFTAGQTKIAHDLWKDAAAIEPYNEQVWLALLEVLDADEDRRVCLQNIIAINPLNVQARRQLNRIEARKQRQVIHQHEQKLQRLNWMRRRRQLLRRAILLGIAIGVSGAIFAVVISILLYAR